MYVYAGLLILLLVLLVLYKWRASKSIGTTSVVMHSYLPSAPTQLINRIRPVEHNFDLQQKDSLEGHLNLLTKKLAEKEGCVRVSKSKVRETQNEIDNLQAIDAEIQNKYMEVMNSLRSDLLGNEKECRRLQEEIEWFTRRRGEINEEIRQSQQIYGRAVTDLASNLTELQRGRNVEHTVIDKPYITTCDTARIRKEPYLPRTSPFNSIIIKSSPPYSDECLAPIVRQE